MYEAYPADDVKNLADSLSLAVIAVTNLALASKNKGLFKMDSLVAIAPPPSLVAF